MTKLVIKCIASIMVSKIFMPLHWTYVYIRRKGDLLLMRDALQNTFTKALWNVVSILPDLVAFKSFFDERPDRVAQSLQICLMFNTSNSFSDIVYNKYVLTCNFRQYIYMICVISYRFSLISNWVQNPLLIWTVYTVYLFWHYLRVLYLGKFASYSVMSPFGINSYFSWSLCDDIFVTNSSCVIHVVLLHFSSGR